MQRGYLRISFGVLGLILFLAWAVFAQTPKATPTPVEDDEVIRVESRLVIVPVSVTDSSGQPVLNLRKEDFIVSEENKQQEIAQVSDAEKVPLEIALLIDVSGSVNPLFEFEKNAAAQFLESTMRPEDRATIFLIGDQPALAAGRETAGQAAGRVRTIVLSGKYTAFYDTVTTAANYLQKNAPPQSRRVILALTDGEDNWSSLTREAEKNTYRDIDVNGLTTNKLNQLAGKTDAAHQRAQGKILRDLQNADTVFYAINPAGASYKLNKISLRAQNGMQRFADQTGGAAFLPNFQPVDLKDAYQNSANTRRNQETLTRIFRQLANELQAQYLVQYYSETDFPKDKYVKLNVGLRNPQNYRLRARQGYFVKK
ncbi:MAG TPA: VWA domain-containing protein [Pyrinomonadaceae bacterium]|jgi:Ca-activated chloride channel family protein